MRLRLEQSASNGLCWHKHSLSTLLFWTYCTLLLKAHQIMSFTSVIFPAPAVCLALFCLRQSLRTSWIMRLRAWNIFAIGDSWGGYESLIKQAHLDSKLRQFTPEHSPGHLIRVYAGIEHGADLQTDLFQMLDALE